MGWRVRWWLHAWTGGTGRGSMAEDREGVRTFHVDTVAELHHLVEQVRADPTVRRYQFGPFDELDLAGGPTHCRCGRELHGHHRWAAKSRWYSCLDCPGHAVYRCQGCNAVTTWPPPSIDCAPSKVDRRRRPPAYPDAALARRLSG